jgi:hypothetical protein
MRRQGNEARKVDSLKPRKYILLELVEWKLTQCAKKSIGMFVDQISW